MRTIDYIQKKIHVIVDRPLGSTHPKNKDIAYFVNYGFVPNTISGDGEELDCYILGINFPLKSFDGICIGVIQRFEEDDDKLIVVPEGICFSDDEIEKKVYFQERFFTYKIIR